MEPRKNIIEPLIIMLIIIAIFIMTCIIAYREGQKDALNGKYKYELDKSDIDVKRIKSWK